MKEILATLFTTRSWVVSQILVIFTEITISFLAITLLKNNTEEKYIILMFALIYLFNFILLKYFRYIIFKYKYYTSVFLTLISSLSFINFIITNNIYMQYLSMFISVASIMTLKDVYLPTSISGLQINSKNRNISSQKVIAGGMSFGLISIPVFISLFGVVKDFSVDLYYIFLSISLLLTMFLFNKRVVLPIDLKENNINIPYKVYCLCFLSLIVNMSSFIIMRFLFPIAILYFSQIYGIESNVYSFLGAVIALVSLITLASKKFSTKDINNTKLILVGYGICIFTLSIISVVAFLLKDNNLFAINNINIIFGVFVISYLINQIFARLWTIGFLEHMKKIAYLDSNKHDYYKVDDINRVYLHLFLIFKSIGGFLGFSIVFIITLFSMSIFIGNMIMLFLCLIYWLIYIFSSKMRYINI